MDLIKKITGIPSNSASPTDTFIIEYNNPMPFQLDSSYSILTDKIFFKTFIQPNSIPLPIKPEHKRPRRKNPKTDEEKRLHYEWDKYELEIENRDKNKRYLSGLLYETTFYMDIVKAILDSKISPHFQRYYTVLNGLSYDYYVDTILENKIDEKQIRRNLLYMLKMKGDRPSITESVKSTDQTLDLTIAESLRFTLLGLMPIDNTNTKKLAVYLKELIPANSTILTSEQISNMHVLYFQLLQACYVLYRSGATHNDIHAGNVWVTRRPDMYQKIRYIIDKKYDIKTNLCARIYDFDRAYAKRIGNNPINNKCDTTSKCNTVSPMKDFLKIYCYIRYYIKSLLNINDVSKNSILINGIPDIFFNDTSCFLKKANGEALKDGEYMSRFTSSSYITYFNSFYEKINNSFTDDPDFTFDCSDSRFQDAFILVSKSFYRDVLRDESESDSDEEKNSVVEEKNQFGYYSPVDSKLIDPNPVEEEKKPYRSILDLITSEENQDDPDPFGPDPFGNLSLDPNQIGLNPMAFSLDPK